MHPAAKAQLLFVKADEVVQRCTLYCIVIGKVGLQHNSPRIVAPPGSTRHLSQKLKCALRRPEIRKAERSIGSDHSHKRDARNVMPLRDHLRTDEQIQFAFVQRIECALEVVASANCIAVQARNARLRKHTVEQLFQLLRSGPKKVNVLAAAMHASFRHWSHMPAVMALHPA